MTSNDLCRKCAQELLTALSFSALLRFKGVRERPVQGTMGKARSSMRLENDARDLWLRINGKAIGFRVEP